MPGPCGLGKISKFRGTLPGYQIIVIDFKAHNTSIYEGPQGNKKIVPYKNGDHYNVINPTKLPAFHGKRFFSTIIMHTSVQIHAILACARNAFGFPEEKRTCSDCFKICHSTQCFDQHKKTCKSKGVDLPSKCEFSFKCQTCSVTVERK